MLGFVFRKIRNKRWMVASLLIGNLLMVAIAAVSPMYSQAVLQRTLIRRLGDSYEETGQHPGTILISGMYADVARDEQEYFDVVAGIEPLLTDFTEELQVPVLSRAVQYYRANVKATHEILLEEEKNEVLLKLSSCAGLEDHIRIVNGKMYEPGIKDHTFDVIVNERTFVKYSLMLGEELELVKIKDESGIPYKIRIAGIFESTDAQDPWWISDPAGWYDVCLMDEQLFAELFIDPSNKNYKADWKAVLDYTGMRGEETEHYLAVSSKYLELLDENNFKKNEVLFLPVLEVFQTEAQKLNTTIMVLQVPILLLLAVFIFMVSGQMLGMEQNEIAVYKSRGAKKKQIFLLYLLQSILISVCGMIGGIPLGMLICRVLGSANSFLEFVQRTALPVEMGPEVWLYAGIAAVFSVCTMVLPVIKYADVNIVAHKRSKNRSSTSSWWQKIFLDVVLLGVALYGWYHYQGQREFLMQQVQSGKSLDPLLYFCSSLFMIGAGLLVLRIFPLLVRTVFTVGKKWWSPVFYASFLRILRTKSNQSFLMVFLILTMAMGIFNAQAARSINANGEDRIRYSIGADLVLQEKWLDNRAENPKDLVYMEPDFGKYETMEGIAQATKVLVDKNVKISVDGGNIRNAMVMGIHTKEFGETAWFQDSLLPAHWYEYLNAISQNSRAILVSSNFREIYGYEIGDVLFYTNENGRNASGIIYGFVDYWPAYSPVIRIQEDGIEKESDQFLVVAHLSQLQSGWGVTPYQIWIRTEGSSQFIYDYAETSQTKYAVFQDAEAELIRLKNDPVFQGTNGVLTVGFVCVLLVCIVGFLIYWILSIQSRTLQFGIFCAMGMTVKEVLYMLLVEQFFITGISILAGAAVGIIASRLFVPLIQIAYTSADQVIPLRIVSEAADYARLFTVVGLAILVCMIILGVLISKIRIAQALKLGED